MPTTRACVQPMKIGQFRGHNTEQAHNTEWKTNSGQECWKGRNMLSTEFFGVLGLVFFFEGGGGCKIMSSS